ncbi:MAG: fibronectin type III domain-containing protein, partial [Patulibacter sp.]|nr:fibronectin type III domain-containing protein [Patulibacter sp.]
MTLASAAPVLVVSSLYPTLAQAAATASISGIDVNNSGKAIAYTPGGDVAFISGTGLDTVTGVTVDGVAVQGVTPDLNNTLSFTTPAHAKGTAQVRLVTAGGTTTDAGTLDDLTYIDPPPSPVITKLSPNFGPVGGGNTIIITGQNLTGASAVFFGSSAAADSSSITQISDTQIKVVVPAPFTTVANGTKVDVLVLTDGGANSDTAADDYTFGSAPVDSTPPSTPGTPTFSNITATGATVSWAASTDDTAVVSYDVTANGVTKTVTGTSTTLAGLTASTSYPVTVTAKDAAGNVSGIASGTLKTSAAPDTTAPSTPTNATASNITQTGATISWTASTDNVGVTGYDVTANGKTTTVTGTSTTLAGLTANTSYPVTIKARDAAGNLSAAASVTVKTLQAPDTTAPSAPGTPSVTNITGTGASVSWTAATDNVGVTAYDVTVNGQTTTVTGTSTTIAGLTSATSYTVTVKAKDA